MPNPNEQPVTPPADPATPTPEAATGLNLAPESLPPVDAGLLAAAKAAVSGEPAPAPVADPPAGDPPPADPAAVVDPNAPPADPAAPPADPAKPPVDPATPKPDEPPAAKPSDAFGELPADAKAETKERFNKLRTSYDETVGKLTAAETAAREAAEQRDQWREAVISTGADAQQFGQTLAFLKDLNSGTPDGLERAYDALHGQLAILAKALGKEVPGVYDPLAEHKDLQARLDDHADPLTREDAVEIARARNRAALLEQGQREQASRAAETRTAQTFEQQQTAALADIQAFGASMRATDQLYAAKMAAIGPAVKRIVAKLPPSEWAAEVKALYAETVVAAPPAPRPVAKVPDPIRPSASPAGTGGASKAPGSALEAAKMALGMG